MNLPERVKAAGFVALIVVSAVGLVLSAQTFRPNVPALTAGISVSMTIEGADWVITYSRNDTRNNTVHLFLLEAARSLHFALVWSNWSAPYSAVFIDGINGSMNGDGGRWWVFWVDGAYGNTAADLAVLHGGDHILWRFTVPEGG